jgi:hypothetical protein
MRETTIRSRSLATDDLSPEGTKRQKAMFGLQALTTSHDGMWQIGQASWSADQHAGTITFTSYQVSSGPAQTRTEKRTRGGLISTDGGSGDRFRGQHTSAPWQGVRSSVGANPTRHLGRSSRWLSKRRGEETKPSEPSRQMGRFGDSASRQAVIASQSGDTIPNPSP